MAHNKKIIARYARVLLNHAVKNGVVEAMSQGVSFLQDQFKDHPMLDSILNNPTIPRSEKCKLLNKICATAVGPLLWRFIEIIIDHRQIGYLKEILASSWVLYCEHIGIQSAKLTTAISLPEHFTKRFIEEAKQFVSCKKVVLEQRIDPSIIGGYILEIGGFKIDKSVKHHLHALQSHFAH
ncbi:ATP synthase F1 subunit delta [Cardinium endosymbiont of Tipula unca]|uniref:ATP synthase F1 subunit delta n=1 Tax=Cardinium endosymbiont of Tipula unca TaxID=3066216 RepID=UPI0030D16258